MFVRPVAQCHHQVALAGEGKQEIKDKEEPRVPVSHLITTDRCGNKWVSKKNSRKDVLKAAKEDPHMLLRNLLPKKFCTKEILATAFQTAVKNHTEYGLSKWHPVLRHVFFTLPPQVQQNKDLLCQLLKDNPHLILIYPPAMKTEKFMKKAYEENPAIVEVLKDAASRNCDEKTFEKFNKIYEEKLTKTQPAQIAQVSEVAREQSLLKKIDSSGRRWISEENKMEDVLKAAREDPYLLRSLLPEKFCTKKILETAFTTAKKGGTIYGVSAWHPIPRHVFFTLPPKVRENRGLLLDLLIKHPDLILIYPPAMKTDEFMKEAYKKNKEVLAKVGKAIYKNYSLKRAGEIYDLCNETVGNPGWVRP